MEGQGAVGGLGRYLGGQLGEAGGHQRHSGGHKLHPHPQTAGIMHQKMRVCDVEWHESVRVLIRVHCTFHAGCLSYCEEGGEPLGVGLHIQPANQKRKRNEAPPMCLRSTALCVKVLERDPEECAHMPHATCHMVGGTDVSTHKSSNCLTCLLTKLQPDGGHFPNMRPSDHETIRFQRDFRTIHCCSSWA